MISIKEAIEHYDKKDTFYKRWENFTAIAEKAKLSRKTVSRFFNRYEVDTISAIKIMIAIGYIPDVDYKYPEVTIESFYELNKDLIDKSNKHEQSRAKR